MINEGSAVIMESESFYNPNQSINRDLSVLALRCFSDVHMDELNRGVSLTKKKINLEKPGIDILDAFAATGIRSIRYQKEIPNIRSILVNDFDSTAISGVYQNLKINSIDTDICIPNLDDCNRVMYDHAFDIEKRFDVIDIDPYGSAADYLDGAVRAIDDGGMLCITCTDLPVLCGVYPETCWTKYQSISVGADCSHENALRILLGSIQSTASKYKKVIEPLMSFYTDFYVRVFVRVRRSPMDCKQIFSKMGYLIQCNGCRTITPYRLGKIVEKNNHLKYKITSGVPVQAHSCEFCGDKSKMIGPMWLNPIHNRTFLGSMIKIANNDDVKLQNRKRALTLLHTCSEELPEVPYFYKISKLCKALKMLTIPNRELISAILNLGYEWSYSHCQPDSIKTNAPNDVIWDILLAWRKASEQGGEDRLLETGKKILSRNPVQIDFTTHPNWEITDNIPRFFTTQHQGPATKPKKTIREYSTLLKKRNLKRTLHHRSQKSNPFFNFKYIKI